MYIFICHTHRQMRMLHIWTHVPQLFEHTHFADRFAGQPFRWLACNSPRGSCVTYIKHKVIYCAPHRQNICCVGTCKHTHNTQHGYIWNICHFIEIAIRAAIESKTGQFHTFRMEKRKGKRTTTTIDCVRLRSNIYPLHNPIEYYYLTSRRRSTRTRHSDGAFSSHSVHDFAPSARQTRDRERMIIIHYFALSVQLFCRQQRLY